VRFLGTGQARQFRLDHPLKDGNMLPLRGQKAGRRDAVNDKRAQRKCCLSVFVDDRPRADMPGFVPWERDLQRQVHRQKYLAIELDTRKAIRQRRN
jgi:hypothetical protein